MRFMINREILLTKLYKPYKTQLGEAGCRSCRSGAFALFLIIIVSVPFLCCACAFAILCNFIVKQKTLLVFFVI